MAKISDYPKVVELAQNNVLLLDGENGTKGIFASDLGKALLSLMTTKEIMDNINISDLEAASTLDGDSALLISTTDGNRRINLSDAVFAMLDPVISVENRRNIWRGKNLGSVATEDQLSEIKAGTFKGLFLGDYWEIGGRIWRIMDFDYWWLRGDVACLTHHLVIMPDNSLYSAPMNDTDTTVGGYVGSKMYTTNLQEAKTIIKGAFGEEHILNHRDYLINGVTDGYPSAGAFFDSDIELPNEIMYLGFYEYTPAGNGSLIPIRYTTDSKQLAAMTKDSRLFSSTKRENYWLRDSINIDRFAFMDSLGSINHDIASKSYNVRPVFGLQG